MLHSIYVDSLSIGSHKLFEYLIYQSLLIHTMINAHIKINHVRTQRLYGQTHWFGFNFSVINICKFVYLTYKHIDMRYKI